MKVPIQQAKAKVEMLEKLHPCGLTYRNELLKEMTLKLTNTRLLIKNDTLKLLNLSEIDHSERVLWDTIKRKDINHILKIIDRSNLYLTNETDIENSKLHFSIKIIIEEMNKRTSQLQQQLEQKYQKSHLYSIETLWDAIKRKDIECAIELIETYNLDLQIQDKDNHGQTALHKAARNDLYQIVEALLKAKCNIEQRDSSQSTAIMIAALKGSSSCVKLLIGAGSDLNAKTNLNRTALHHAALNGHPETCQLLIEGGCAKNDQTDSKHTPLDYAVNSSNVYTCRIMY